MTADPHETAEPTDSTQVLSKHFALFFDFLGTSNAAASWDAAKVSRFIPILRALVNSRQGFSADGEAQPDGSLKLTMQAEISTFSDNVVASFPVIDGDEEESMSLADQVTLYLELAAALVSSVAFHALNLSMLVRGGISLGDLYHHKDVVFGEALVNAYALESRVANYPRIVVSPRVYLPKSKKDRLSARRNSLLQDADGVWHLNYFSQMLDAVAPSERQDYLAKSTAHIDGLIAQFEKVEKLNEFSKWSWFRSQYVAHTGPR